MTVLIITASPNKDSVSTWFAKRYINMYQKFNPHDDIEWLDISTMNFPAFSEGIYNIITGNGGTFTLDEKRSVAFYNRLLHQLMLSDKLVFAYPVWNMFCPPCLVQYISAVSRRGITHNIVENKREGRFAGKKAFILSTADVDESEDKGLASQWLADTLSSFGFEPVYQYNIPGVSDDIDDFDTQPFLSKLNDIAEIF